MQIAPFRYGDGDNGISSALLREAQMLASRIGIMANGRMLCIRPADALENYEGKVLAEGENMTLSQANEALSAARGDMLHVQITVRNAGANSFGVRLRRNDRAPSTQITITTPPTSGWA